MVPHTKHDVCAKGPKSVETRKAKGHATDEMVATGTVRQADKDGNDHADEAAGFGSKKEQGSLSTLTTLYAQRHIEYQKNHGTGAPLSNSR